MGLVSFFRRATTPTHRIYAIGDVHGCLGTLNNLLSDIHEDIDRERKKNPAMQFTIVAMGDYGDRGPDSKGVIDRMISESKKQDGVNRVFIKGNHDRSMVKFWEISHPVKLAHLFANLIQYGGLQNFASYGAYLPDDIGRDFIPELMANKKFEPNDAQIKTLWVLANDMRQQMRAATGDPIINEHLNFLRKTKITYEIDGLPWFFCHAGVDPTKPLDQQDKRILVGVDDSLRDAHTKKTPSRAFATYHDGPIGEKQQIVVHGHTVVSKHESDRSLTQWGRIPVDTGCYQAGGLSAAVLQDGEKIGWLNSKTIEPAYDCYQIPERPEKDRDLAKISLPTIIAGEEHFPRP